MLLLLAQCRAKRPPWTGPATPRPPTESARGGARRASPSPLYTHRSVGSLTGPRRVRATNESTGGADACDRTGTGVRVLHQHRHQLRQSVPHDHLRASARNCAGGSQTTQQTEAVSSQKRLRS